MGVNFSGGEKDLIASSWCLQLFAVYYCNIGGSLLLRSSELMVFTVYGSGCKCFEVKENFCA